MRIWPRREDRTANPPGIDVASAASNSLLASASGTFPRSAIDTPAAGAAATVLAGALGLLEPSGPAWAGQAVTTRWLRRVGHDLMLRGEHLSAIGVASARPTLTAAWTWERLSGGGWQVDQATPGTEAVQDRVPDDAVVSIVLEEDPARPWRGLPPHRYSGLAAALEDTLRQEAAGQVGHLVAGVPRSASSTAGEVFDPGLQTLDELRGQTATVPMKMGFDPAAGPNADSGLKTVRIGADTPKPVVDAQAQANAQALDSMGVPSGLFSSGQAATIRESWRLLIQLLVTPVRLLLIDELRAKLDPAFDLGDSRLPVSDIAARARAAKALVEAGWSRDEAAAAAGLR